MAGTEPRGWQVWRKAFWTRPAFLAFYAVLVPTVGVACLVGAWSEYQNVRGLDEAPRCAGVTAAESADRDCLLEVAGFLDGPHYSRGPGSKWSFRWRPDDVERVRVATRGSWRLEGLPSPRVTGLLWHGELVAFEADGELVPSDEYGARSWTWLVLAGIACAGGGVMLSQAASSKRRLAGSWWRVTAERVTLTEPTWRTETAQTLVASSLTAILVYAVGLPLSVMYGTFAAVLVLVAAGFVRRRRVAAARQS